MGRVSNALRRINPEESWRRITPAAVGEEMLDSVLEGMAEENTTADGSQAAARPVRTVDSRSAPASIERAPIEAIPVPGFNGFTFDNPLSAHLVLAPEIAASAVEQYRKLATVLHQAQTERKTQVIVVASALPSDGKTLTAANLALTLSESFRRKVLLIDADLRKPSQQDIFGAPLMPGLSQALTADSDRRLQVLQPSPNLSVLFGGLPAGDPVTGLSSERMRHLLEDARGHFDWVIIDTPPAAMLPDVKLLSPLSDGALLVVRAGVTPYHAIERAIEALGRDQILGVVLNAADAVDVPGYGYSSDHYRVSATATLPEAPLA